MRLTKIATVVHGAGQAVLRATLAPCGRTVVATVEDRTVAITVGGTRSTDEHLERMVKDALDTQRILLEGRPDMMF
jgi:hypothetical protein